MKNVGSFYKVSFDEFVSSIERFKEHTPLYKYAIMDRAELKEKVYDKIKLPDRSTKDSAGYDFYFPFEDIVFCPGESFIIPTGIRVKIIPEWFLAICPKSGLSFDYKIRLDDTIAIIDGDYFYTKNEGHIYLKLTNENDRKSYSKQCRIPQNSKIVQGIFLPYGLTVNDNCTVTRTGGMGHSDQLQKLAHTV